MNKLESILMSAGAAVVRRLPSWMSTDLRRRQAGQKIQKLALEIEKIKEKSNADIQLIRERSMARTKSKILILEELKLKYKIKYGGK